MNVRLLGGRVLGYLLVASLSWSVSLDAFPENYYPELGELAGESLRTQLEGVIDGHTRISYGDLRQALPQLHEDPLNSDNIILLYSQASILKSYRDGNNGITANDSWNREHLWPQSYLNVSNSHPAYSDMFHVFPAYKGVNSARGNKYFDNTDLAVGRVGHVLAPLTTTDTNSWEPADGQKGVVARAMLYLTTRYNFLQLVNTPETVIGTSFQRMAQLDVLLEWNRRLLPDTTELTMNERIYSSFQFNRNPFIDIPEFADRIFVDGPSWGDWRLTHFSYAELADPAISGDFADPDADGLPNLLERALYSDPRSVNGGGLQVAPRADGQYEIRFIRASDLAHLGLQLALQVSSDLADWDDVPLESAATNSIDPLREQVILFVTPPAQGSSFYRLKAVSRLEVVPQS